MPRALLLEGEPGIGKSTLWRAGVTAARASGHTVLAMQAAKAEAALSHTGLADLLEEAGDDVVRRLPEPQQGDLEVALLRRSPRPVPPAPAAVARALLSLVRDLARLRPVLIAVDDLQWLDEETLALLTFALRRLADEPVTVLATARPSALDPVVPDLATGRMPEVRRVLDEALPGRASSLVLGPLPPDRVGRLLVDRLGLVLVPGDLARVTERSRGNPFWALEIGAALVRHGAGAVAELPVPERVQTLVARRLATVEPAVGQALAVVSALARPQVDLVLRALAGLVEAPDAALDGAVLAGLVTEDAGRPQPAHPLLGEAALRALPPARRLALHRRLADVVTDPESRARHLALAAGDGPAGAVAAALDEAAELARRRGAGRAAADLAEQAVRFTPPTDRDAFVRRRLTLAELLFVVGEPARAGAAIEDLDLDQLTTPTLERMLPVVVDVLFWNRGAEPARALVERVLATAGADAHRRALGLALAADEDYGDLARRAEAAEEAIRLADELGTATTALHRALASLLAARLDGGEDFDHALADRAERLEAELGLSALNESADAQRAFGLKAVDDLAGSRTALARCLDAADRRGDDTAGALFRVHLACVEYLAGDYPAAGRALDEAAGLAEWGDHLPPVLLAARGQLLLARGELDAAAALVAGQRGKPAELPPRHELARCCVLGELAARRGDPVEAAQLLGQARRTAERLGIREPGRRYRLDTELGEALVGAGRLDDAGAVASGLRELADRLDRPVLRGIALRIDGLAAAARGEVGAAVELLHAATAEHQNSPFRLELGRTLLALGRVHRRGRALHRARTTLEQALDRFAELGAAAFADQALAELARTTASTGGLTGTELRVARLVAAGSTNREVAAALFVSVRTVESHLAAVYRKLGIRSRTEVVHALCALGQD